MTIQLSNYSLIAGDRRLRTIFPTGAAVLLLLLSFFLIAGAGGCARQELPPVLVTLPQHDIDYLTEIKPILDARCVVCHSCYNSPCQLKLSSYDGVDRGATKKAVYNSKRLHTMDPTRLFVDAQSREEWREKGFFSVTQSSHEGSLNDSIMLQLLAHKIENPKSSGEYRSEADDLTCAENGSELASYLDKHPNNGMPFGFPPLQQHEFNLIAGWLAQGAKGPTDWQQQRLEAIAAADLADVEKWESFFNLQDAKHIMTARYLYEHLFLAHIRFDTASTDFYELVRSRTPPGEEVEVVATVRPYDDPGGPFYYRFRKIHGTIVHKTHMVFTLDEQAYQRYHQLFISPAWQTEPQVMSYDERISADPFTTFAQIPVRSRYQFLLDHSHYIIMTFIRGPVCKGQVALNVINDHFWIMFLDPEADLTVRYPAFLKLHADKLVMPAIEGNDISLLKALKNPYHDLAMAYHRERQDYYMSHYYHGLNFDDIWMGRTSTDAPLLTVFRHFDSASVHRGALGGLPRTFWVLDYPLIERIYYSLVAGFDVYGKAWHQLTTRLYMDALRREAESNFLDFLPPEKREDVLMDWYRGMDFFHVRYHTTNMPAAITYETDEPQREFVERLIEDVFPREMDIELDRVNYRKRDETTAETHHSSNELKVLYALHGVSDSGDNFFAKVTDHNANVAYIRVKIPDAEDVVVSVVIHRWHDNVTFLFGEENTLDPARDNADFFAGFIGSYPNYFFELEMSELDDFIAVLDNYRGSKEDIRQLARYGINRSDDRFWEVFDWLQERFLRTDPVQAGLFDLNRYYHKAH